MVPVSSLQEEMAIATSVAPAMNVSLFIIFLDVSENNCSYSASG
jgi:hypothetical protein